jgi:phosphatidylglycerophosphate synthase
MDGQPYGIGISDLGKLLDSLADKVMLFFQVVY